MIIYLFKTWNALPAAKKHELNGGLSIYNWDSPPNKAPVGALLDSLCHACAEGEAVARLESIFGGVLWQNKSIHWLYKATNIIGGPHIYI